MIRDILQNAVGILRGTLHKLLDSLKISRKPKVSWREQRLSEVVKNLVGEDGLLSDYPYIESGIYHWKGLTSSIKLDLVFQELALAVVVTEEYYGKYDAVRKIAPSRQVWESYMKEESEKILSCKAAEFPLLFITPDDPIDIYSLSIAIDKLLNITAAGENTEEEE